MSTTVRAGGGMTSKIDRREFLLASAATAGLSAIGTGSLQAKTSRVSVVGLKADVLDRPLGLENPRPRLSWRLQSSERSVRQSAYQILVASTEAALEAGRGDLWDSGKVRSRKSLGIPYQGRPLTSRQRCWWSVQVWDERDLPSAPSAASWWEMGLLNPKDWTAQWLAIEDPVAKADREAGLHWIWGPPSKEPCVRRFRLKFNLPEASRGGEFFATTNDWAFWPQITAVFIDGSAILGPTAFTSAWVRGVVTESESARLALAPLTAGEHVLAVEVSTGPLWENMMGTDYVHAVAWQGRFNLANGETLRLGSGANVKTSLVKDSSWYAPAYDDAAWEAAQASTVHHQAWPPQPAMHLRREFSLDEPVVKARLYATALGAYEARINGVRVGDALLTPELSQYAKRVLYQSYDVTSMLRRGANALGLTVGDGWYASFDGRYAWGLPPRRALVQLELTLASGARRTIATGPDWRISESAIRESQIRMGEVCDARLEQRGWDTPGFDAMHWRAAEVVDTPSCRLTAQVSQPIRATQVLKPQALFQPQPGIYRFDFGQCFAGRCRLRVKGARGTRIELTFAELLNPSGELHQSSSNMGHIKKDIYILRGDEAGETFEPQFAYRGFRYVEVKGLPTAPTAETIEGLFIHSDLPATGRLRSADPLIEKTWQLIVQTQRSNYVSVQTDNPTREQRGHLMDAAVFIDVAAFNMDVHAFIARHMDNVIDDQREVGAFTAQAPEPFSNNALFNQVGAPGAAHAGIAFPWFLWQRYGDVAIIERHWAAMNRHLQFILDHNPDYVWRNQRGPDWPDHADLQMMEPEKGLPSTPTDLIGTAYWAYAADLLAQMAQALGRTGEAKRLQALRERVRQAFQATFVHADGKIGNDSQAGYIFALKFKLLPEQSRQAAAERLAANIRSRGSSLTTGIMSTYFVLDVLAEAGFVDLIYDLLLRTEYPSWGHMIRNGATGIWETWSGGSEDMKSSQNQPAFGSVGGFLFRRIAGIDAATPGFESIVVHPVLDPRVKSGGGDYDSIMGRISTDWAQAADGRFTLRLTIPTNASAQVHLPAMRGSRIEEGGQEVFRREDMRVVSRLDHEAVIEVGSGSYQFVVAG